MANDEWHHGGECEKSRASEHDSQIEMCSKCCRKMLALQRKRWIVKMREKGRLRREKRLFDSRCESTRERQ
jgi:hypothetical protein